MCKKEILRGYLHFEKTEVVMDKQLVSFLGTGANIILTQSILKRLRLRDSN